MRGIAVLLLFAVSQAIAAGLPIPPTRPPMVAMIAPYGLQRGTTVTLTVEGTNLQGADAVLFDDERITGRILEHLDKGEDVVKRVPEDTGAPITDRSRKSVVRLEITVPADALVGRHAFRLRTPLGTTTLRTFWVGDVRESPELESNDAAAQPLHLPVTVNGVLSKDSDVDHYSFDAKRGHQIVAEMVAAPLGSRLDSTIELLSTDGKLIASNQDYHGRVDAVVIHTIPRTGTYTLRVTDGLNGGSDRHFYRLTVGELPYVTSVFPLGTRKDASAPISVQGVHLGALPLGTPAPRPGDRDMAPLRVATSGRPPLNQLQVALGRHPEVVEREGNNIIATAQPVAWPATINGRITSAAGTADRDLFRFDARKGQQVVFTVAAERLGSPLDSVIEVLDAAGREIPRALVRPVWETSVDLRNQGSLNQDLRVLNWSELRRGDYIFVDRELMRIRELPKGPDESLALFGFRGRRVSFENTSPEGHALNRPVYKVELHAPGTRLSPNGLPIYTLTYRNDDGAAIYGKDSHLTFTAPANGKYILRLSDSRRLGGPLFAYRLTIAPPDPDFVLYVTPPNPNVPKGGRMPITITAFRQDDFDGPIEVEMYGLPRGMEASRGVILPGNMTVALTLSASEEIDPATIAPLRVVGRAQIGARAVAHEVLADEPISVVSVAPPTPLRIVSVEPSQIELEPGGRAKVRVQIARDHGFGGRIPLAVQNLPFLVTIPDIGLNGILITEAQESREFEIVADERAVPLEQTLFISGRAETNGGAVEAASTPFMLKVHPKGHASATVR